MITLGIQPGDHEGSACIVKDGELLAFAETDRFTRTKFGTIKAFSNEKGHDVYLATPTHHVVGAVLEQTGLTINDVDAVAIGWGKVQLGWTSRHLGYETPIEFAISIYPNNLLYDEEKYLEELLPSGLFPRRKKLLVYFVGHHRSHAASAYYTSGYQEAAILVADGWGDDEATSLFYGKGSEITLLRSFKHSIGNVYDHATNWANLGGQSPGKLMGLAPYGSPLKVPSMYELTPKGYQYDYPNEGNPQAYWTELHDFAKESEALVMDYADFAATVQHDFEKVMRHLVEIVKNETESDNLVIAGGCGQNCTFNGLLAAAGENVFVPPVPNDAGVSLGAALWVEREHYNEQSKQMSHAYYGYLPSENEVEETVRRSGMAFYKGVSEEHLVQRVAGAIADGKIVAWYQGRAEIGARALGARSLLADPRDFGNWKRVNQVKGRELWRPLAPSVLKEHAEKFFDTVDSPLANFMVGAFQVKPESRSEIPACVHVDGSARPQFVDKETNPRYHALISAFYERTGVPVVLNTSFNLAGEAIVHSPQDAINSFVRSDIDVLVINDYYIERSNAKKQKNEKVVIGWISAGSIYNEFALSVMDIVKNRSSIVTGVLSAVGAYISQNRHRLVTAFLETDANWLFMLDTDVVITAEDFDVLFKNADPETCPVLSGKYFFEYPHEEPHFRIAAHTAEGWLTDYQENEIVKNLNSVGCGYVLIHRSALEKVRDDNPDSVSPWFWNGFEESGMAQSEDSYFCSQLRKSGIPIALHTGANSKHIGKMAVTEKHFRNQ